jgi:hypothetical protein
MNSENNSPNTQERQDDYSAPETADRERISRLAKNLQRGLNKDNSITTRGTASLQSNSIPNKSLSLRASPPR